MKRFKEYLQERTLKVNADVDFIYNKFFKDIIKAFDKGDFEKVIKLSNRTMLIHSSELKTKDSKKGNAIIPIEIIFSPDANLNAYDSLHNKITFHISKNIIQVLSQMGNQEQLRIGLGKQYFQFNSEFTAERLKGLVMHELSHWLDDALHNKHITSKMNRAKEYTADYERINMVKKLISDGDNVNSGYVEIEGQIHSIVQLKRSYKSSWDEMTYEDLLRLNPSLLSIDSSLKQTPKVYAKWKKALFKRMNREGLLGKQMR